MDAGGRADAWGWGRSAEKGAVAAMIAGAGYAHRTLYSSLDTFPIPAGEGFPALRWGSLPCFGRLWARSGTSWPPVSPLFRLFYAFSTHTGSP